ncbi:MAG: epoxyqueuosine reductase QueH, partial [Eggerthellaceae bacterium]|nr:epoxyqueuosine reductase QueH [Eggerthellaceae bacterium]
MNAPDKKRPKILLHACCGPCSLEPVRLLRERGLEPALMFANNNIHPKDEWQRRWDTLTSWTKTQNLIVMHGPYNPK